MSELQHQSRFIARGGGSAGAIPGQIASRASFDMIRVILFAAVALLSPLFAAVGAAGRG